MLFIDQLFIRHTGSKARIKSKTFEAEKNATEIQRINSNTSSLANTNQFRIRDALHPIHWVQFLCVGQSALLSLCFNQ